ncbi:ATP-binding protein [Nocardiopsis sp. NPDC058631]|uniref:ATP-binding protein n=1 Tax=Nocardiopsis sp. NPDC058631 TaxID=3346566 RepID=UPI003648E695
MYERSTPMPPAPRRPEMLRFVGRFPHQLTSVRDARAWLSQRLDLARIPESPTHDALLVLSELTTNALLHTPGKESGGAFFVSLFAYPQCLRVCVWTNGESARLPRLEVVRARLDAENGRGLFLVDTLAHTWGVERTRFGPAVYFTLAWDAPRPPGYGHRHAQRSGHLRPLPRPRVAHHDTGRW